MMIVGLTGSIWAWASRLQRDAAAEGKPYRADASVHAMQAKGGVALPTIEAAFPGVVQDGVLNRQPLGARVFGNKGALRRRKPSSIRWSASLSRLPEARCPARREAGRARHSVAVRGCGRASVDATLV